MAFRFDKLTIKAQEAVQAAQERAADAGNPQIDVLHLLAALLAESDAQFRTRTLAQNERRLAAQHRALFATDLR